MAIVVYKCDTCNREIEVPQNLSGIEIMSRCIITHGCKGKLIQTQVKTSHIRGKLPAPDPTGLKDWLPRQAYYKQDQPLLLHTWKIKHNLGTNPSIRVVIELDGGTPFETEEFEVKYVSLFESWIIFTEPRRGNVQCFARNSITEEDRELLRVVKPTAELSELTANHILTLAISPTFQDRISITFKSADTNNIIGSALVTFPPAVSTISPWKTLTVNNDDVFFMGNRKEIKTLDVTSYVSALGVPVPDGSSFYFSGHSTEEYSLPIGSVFALLSSNPHTQYDKNLSQLVDLSRLTNSTTASVTRVANNSMFVDPQLIQSVYPKIIMVS